MRGIKQNKNLLCFPFGMIIYQMICGILLITDEAYDSLMSSYVSKQISLIIKPFDSAFFWDSWYETSMFFISIFVNKDSWLLFILYNFLTLRKLISYKCLRLIFLKILCYKIINVKFLFPIGISNFNRNMMTMWKKTLKESCPDSWIISRTD